MKFIFTFFLSVIIISGRPSIAHDDMTPEEKNRIFQLFENVVNDMNSAFNNEVVSNLTFPNVVGVSNEVLLTNVEIVNEGDLINFRESHLASLLRFHFLNYERLVAEECKCDISEFQRKNRNTFLKVYQFVKGLIINDIHLIRRYGVHIAVVWFFLEAIEHTLLHTPFCKLLKVVAVVTASKFKLFTSLFSTKVTNGNKGILNNMNSALRRRHYNNKYFKKYRKVLKIIFVKNNLLNYEKSKWPLVTTKNKIEAWLDQRYGLVARLNRDLYSDIPTNLEKALKKSGPREIIASPFDDLKLILLNEKTPPEDRIFMTFRHGMALDYLYELNTEIIEIVKEQDAWTDAEFIKIQYSFGAIGNIIDDYMLSLKALSGMELSPEVRRKVYERKLEELGQISRGFKKIKGIIEGGEKAREKLSKLRKAINAMRIDNAKLTEFREGPCIPLLKLLIQ